MRRLSNEELKEYGLKDWVRLSTTISTRYHVPTYLVGARFVFECAELAEEADHHPDIKLSYLFVDVSLCTHEGGRWITLADVELAKKISELARRYGLEPSTAEIQQLEIALDTAHMERVAPFWAALLTGDKNNVTFDSIIDPTDRVPVVWFQETSEEGPSRQRWHFDLYCAYEEAQNKIEAAIETGGRVEDLSHSPLYVVLSDPEGNKVCICTSEGRE
jgi:4a-hydroxytetrahydrobiopterin dehydratase